MTQLDYKKLWEGLKRDLQTNLIELDGLGYYSEDWAHLINNMQYTLDEMNNREKFMKAVFEVIDKTLEKLNK